MNYLDCLYYSVCGDRGCYCPLADHTSIDKDLYNKMEKELEEELAYWEEQSFDDYYDDEDYVPLYKEYDESEDEE